MERSDVRAVFYSILYSAISVLAIGGNGLVIYLIVTYRRMRTVTNYFILNLALGDLLMAVLCIPFTFTANLIVYRWPFGLLMCRLVSYAQAVSVFISAYTLVALSVDRYAAIINPFRVRMTRRHALYLIAFIWFVALLTPLPTAVLSRLVPQSSLYGAINDTSGSSGGGGSEALICTEDWNQSFEYKSYYSVMLMVLQYVVPFTVLVYTYSRIALAIWGRQTPGEADGTRDARIAASKRKMVKMMITCVATFTLCWLPLNALIVIGDRFPSIYQQPHIEYVWVACHWLAMSHASYNPIIYIWMNASFRYGFRRVLGQLVPCVPPVRGPSSAAATAAATATAAMIVPPANATETAAVTTMVAAKGSARKASSSPMVSSCGNGDGNGGDTSANKLHKNDNCLQPATGSWV